MSTILDYRQQFYERHYDIRVICERNESVKSMTNKVIGAVNRYLTEKGTVHVISQFGLSVEQIGLQA